MMDIALPFSVRRFGGDQPGPRLLISAGVHGDEYLPMLAVRKLIRHFESDPGMTGSLTLIPVANGSAFALGNRSGEDHKDLARTCPGNPTGTKTEIVAAALSREIEAADFFVDLHTGGTELSVFPLAGYVLHRNESILEKQRQLARAFQLPFCWGTSAELEGRSLSVARDADVPAIYVEYYGAHRELAEATQEMEADHPLVHGCLNVMRHLDMLAEKESEIVIPEFVEDTRPGSGHMQVSHPAPTGGFLRILVELGETVAEGDPIAEISSLDTTETARIHAADSGRVIVLRDYPRINRGDSIAVIANPNA